MKLISNYKDLAEGIGNEIEEAANEGKTCNVDGTIALLLTDIAHSQSIMAEESLLRTSQRN